MPRAIIFNKPERLAHVEKFKNELSGRFKITTDKSLSYLGIEITRTKHGFLLTQQRLVDSIYEKAKAYIESTTLRRWMFLSSSIG